MIYWYHVFPKQKIMYKLLYKLHSYSSTSKFGSIFLLDTNGTVMISNVMCLPDIKTTHHDWRLSKFVESYLFVIPSNLETVFLHSFTRKKNNHFYLFDFDFDFSLCKILIHPQLKSATRVNSIFFFVCWFVS